MSYFQLISKTALILCVLVMVFSCSNESKKFIPDVSHIKVDSEVHRFDKAFFGLNPLDLDGEINKLSEKYPALSEIYFNQIMVLDNNPTLNTEMMGQMLQDTFIQNLNVRIQNIFPSFETLKEDFNETFQYLKYYFPERDIPDLYTLFTEFGFHTFIFSDENGKDAIGISLELFLGENFPYENYVGNDPAFSSYMKRAFNKDHLIKKSMDVLISDIMPPASQNNLLDAMIYNGKQLYLLDKLMPHAADTVKFEYSLPQWTWVNENEHGIYSHLVHEELLYESDQFKYSKLVKPSPHSPGMPPEAPGKTANFIGFKIVESFMKRNPELNLQDLIAINDSQEIFSKARYKPRYQ